MALRYQTGEEIHRGDRVTYGGNAGVIELVVEASVDFKPIASGRGIPTACSREVRDDIARIRGHEPQVAASAAGSRSLAIPNSCESTGIPWRFDARIRVVTCFPRP
jgi:hypothetical protein